MKKWLNDLYNVLLKNGVNTLNNVLLKYKTQIEDYEEKKINNELIILNPGETIEFDLLNYYDKYDRFWFYNRGRTSDDFIMIGIYKYSDNGLIAYINSFKTDTLAIYIRDTRYMSIKNKTDVIRQLDLYVKKIC